MTYTLRQSTEDDFAFCYRICKENMHDLFCRHWGGWVDEEFKKGFKIPDIKIIAVNDSPIGYFDCEFTETHIHINNIQISASMQGKGIGTRVLNQFVSLHRDKRIILTVFEDNPAKRIYVRLGFSVYHKQGGTIKMELPAQQGDAPEPLTRPGDR